MFRQIFEELGKRRSRGTERGHSCPWRKAAIAADSTVRMKVDTGRGFRRFFVVAQVVFRSLKDRNVLAPYRRCAPVVAVFLASTALAQPLPPEVVPAAGTPVPVTISLSAVVEGGEIRYTLDGTLPTEASTLYTAPISATERTFLRARVYDAEGVGSAVIYARYDPAPGELLTAPDVQIGRSVTG